MKKAKYERTELGKLSTKLPRGKGNATKRNVTKLATTKSEPRSRTRLESMWRVWRIIPDVPDAPPTTSYSTAATAVALPTTVSRLGPPTEYESASTMG